MSNIAATDDYVYTLDFGTIFRQKTNAPNQKASYSGPSGTVTALMATNRHLYALRADGTAARRWHDATQWKDFTVPAGTTQLSSSDHDIYALALGNVHVRHDTFEEVFEHIPEMDLPGMTMLDHDEKYSYTLANGSIYVALQRGTWSLYPQSLLNLEQVVAGIRYIYVRNSTGQIFRSQHIGFSGWSLSGEDSSVLDFAIEVTHRDRLWFIRNGLDFRNPPDWVGGVRPEFYCVADFCVPEYTSTEL